MKVARPALPFEEDGLLSSTSNYLSSTNLPLSFEVVIAYANKAADPPLRDADVTRFETALVRRLEKRRQQHLASLLFQEDDLAKPNNATTPIASTRQPFRPRHVSVHVSALSIPEACRCTATLYGCYGVEKEGEKEAAPSPSPSREGNTNKKAAGASEGEAFVSVTASSASAASSAASSAACLSFRSLAAIDRWSSRFQGDRATSSRGIPAGEAEGDCLGRRTDDRRTWAALDEQVDGALASGRGAAAGSGDPGTYYIFVVLGDDGLVMGKGTGSGGGSPRQRGLSGASEFSTRVTVGTRRAAWVEIPPFLSDDGVLAALKSGVVAAASQLAGFADFPDDSNGSIDRNRMGVISGQSCDPVPIARPDLLLSQRLQISLIVAYGGEVSPARAAPCQDKTPPYCFERPLGEGGVPEEFPSSGQKMEDSGDLSNGCDHSGGGRRSVGRTERPASVDVLEAAATDAGVGFVAARLSPLLDLLDPLVDVSVESQVLLETPAVSHGEWDERTGNWIVAPSQWPSFGSSDWRLDLPFFLKTNSAVAAAGNGGTHREPDDDARGGKESGRRSWEHRAATSTSNAELTFVVYVPPPSRRPLRFAAPQKTKESHIRGHLDHFESASPSRPEGAASAGTASAASSSEDDDILVAAAAATTFDDALLSSRSLMLPSGGGVLVVNPGYDEAECLFSDAVLGLDELPAVVQTQLAQMVLTQLRQKLAVPSGNVPWIDSDSDISPASSTNDIVTRRTAAEAGLTTDDRWPGRHAGSFGGSSHEAVSISVPAAGSREEPVAPTPPGDVKLRVLAPASTGLALWELDALLRARVSLLTRAALKNVATLKSLLDEHKSWEVQGRVVAAVTEALAALHRVSTAAAERGTTPSPSSGERRSSVGDMGTYGDISPGMSPSIDLSSALFCSSSSCSRSGRPGGVMAEEESSYSSLCVSCPKRSPGQVFQLERDFGPSPYGFALAAARQADVEASAALFDVSLGGRNLPDSHYIGVYAPLLFPMLVVFIQAAAAEAMLWRERRRRRSGESSAAAKS